MGGIWGSVVVLLESEELRNTWVANHFSVLAGGLSELAAEITSAAKTLAVAAPIVGSYDLVRHFLKVLPYMQDWDEIAVFDRQSGTFVQQYRYERRYDNDDAKWGWFEEKAQKDDICYLPPSDFPIISATGAHYMWWTAPGDDCTDLWSPDLIPGLGYEEKLRFGNLYFRFKFPEACRIPQKNHEKKYLRESYLRQQLDLFGMLISKVHERRAALRNAAVSIMARNMSHNIGSHVLGAVRNDESTKVSANNLLNEHLQRRMDYIADLATADPLYSADSLLFQEVVGAEYDVNANRFVCVSGEKGENGRGLNRQSLLLQHISGMQLQRSPVTAEICIYHANEEGGDQAPNAVATKGCAPNRQEENQDFNISFNAGVLGWQALYVILENIIRNIAKHSQRSKIWSDTPMIKIWLKLVDGAYPDFFELRVWDECRTASMPREEEESESKDADNHEPNIAYLRRVLTTPNFLEPNNTVAKSAWGMKEMYISAAFLRSIALPNLEDPIPSGEPNIVEACALDACNGEPVEDEDEKGSIGFRLWLPKAKTVALVVDDLPAWLRSLSAGKEQQDRAIGALDRRGVNLLEADLVRARKIKVPHRDAVWFCREPPNDEAKTFLPPDVLLDDGHLKKEISSLLKEDNSLDFERNVGEIVELVRGKVLSQRLDNVSQGRKYHLWAEKGEGKVFPEDVRSLGELGGSEFKDAIVFSDHGEIQKYFDKWIIDLEDSAGHKTSLLSPQEVIDRESGFAFYETRRSSFPQEAFFPALHQRSPKNFEQELLTAALTPVIILDERFQRIARKTSNALLATIPIDWKKAEYTAAFEMGRVWERLGVYVPQAGDCDIDKPAIDPIKIYLNRLAANLPAGAYLIVHQTVFEKLAEHGQELERFLAELANSKQWRNVVCSGRGVPWQLQGNRHVGNYKPRFMALSALLQCLEHMPSKVHLVQLLEVTRAPKKENHNN